MRSAWFFLALLGGAEAGEPASELDGAVLYQQHCGRCHSPRTPDQFSAERWRAAIFHMRTRALLTAAETRALEAFLAPVAPPPPETASGLLANPVVARTCTRCHDATRIEAAVAAGRDAATWAATLERMRTYGADLSAEEAADLADWLVRQATP